MDDPLLVSLLADMSMSDTDKKPTNLVSDRSTIDYDLVMKHYKQNTKTKSPSLSQSSTKKASNIIAVVQRHDDDSDPIDIDLVLQERDEHKSTSANEDGPKKPKHANESSIDYNLIWDTHFIQTTKEEKNDKKQKECHNQISQEVGTKAQHYACAKMPASNPTAKTTSTYSSNLDVDLLIDSPRHSEWWVSNEYEDYDITMESISVFQDGYRNSNSTESKLSSK